jgi:hypothetical protein
MDSERFLLTCRSPRIQGNGANSPAVALTKNALGELYLKMGKVDEGLQMLEEAECVRSSKIPLAVPMQITDCA